MNNFILKQITIIALIIVGTGVGVWLAALLLNNWAKKLAAMTKSGLDDAILNTLRLPLLFGLGLLGFWLVVKQLQAGVSLPLKWIDAVFFVVYWSLVYLIIYRLVVNLSKWYQTDVAHRTETTLDEQILPFFRRIVLMVISVVAVIVLLGHFNVNSSTISAFITTLGIGSLAIALAAQTTLGDTFSGFMIMMDRPFRIGDRVELVDLQTWGDVQDIGLRSTRILTRDNRLVVIPNSVIGQNLVVNHSIPSTVYRVQTHVSVAYGVDIDRVRQVLVEAVSVQDWVMKDKPVEVLFLEFQDSGLLLRVRCWIENYVETRRIIDKLNTCIYKTLNAAAVAIPFPQRVVHIHPENNVIRRS